MLKPIPSLPVLLVLALGDWYWGALRSLFVFRCFKKKCTKIPWQIPLETTLFLLFGQGARSQSFILGQLSALEGPFFGGRVYKSFFTGLNNAYNNRAQLQLERKRPIG
jgi:hypothetical protein